MNNVNTCKAIIELNRRLEAVEKHLGLINHDVRQRIYDYLADRKAEDTSNTEGGS